MNPIQDVVQGYGLEILIGFLFGLFTRLFLLRSDYRHYPSYPHSYIIHLALGSMASLAGSVLFPALAEKDFAGVTFLLLVATQFRDVRKIERDALLNLEGEQLVSRGAEYIEGIARAFEARNYLAMAVAVLSSGIVHYAGWLPAVVIGSAGMLIVLQWRSGRTIADIAEIKLGSIRLEGPDLYVDDVYIMNVGLPEIRRQIQEWAVGIVLSGKSPEAVRTLGGVGQRHALLHDLVDRFGMRKDVATPEFTPLARKNQETGELALYFAPMQKDVDAILQLVGRVPVLESSHSHDRRKQAK